MSAVKTSTGLVGLAVEPRAREILIGLYQTTLAELSKLPAEAGYRKHTETITTYRLNVVEKNEQIPKIEQTIDCGCAEELIAQAKRELGLIEKVKEWKIWEPLVQQAPAKQWQWPM
eukprot:comp15425_c0_seq1/m.12379 comp15425_c0_seq1/g.12379  ORF comp15425_c0_seq1/g.12379 comp15425_c0_seq1/m.12379 type:complete len:116 (-) comp15425_c0_seq1:81-428(-)